MPTSRDPMFQGRKLRAILRRTREEAGHTQREVASEMDWSLSKLIRIESGQVKISTTDLRALLAYYHVTDRGHVDEFVQMARAAKQRSWWFPYRNLITPEFRVLLGYEAAADVMRTFEPLLVPGLLQTEEYARASLQIVGERATAPFDVEGLVSLRLERQERIMRPDGQTMHFIIDEAVIRRQVYGPVDVRGRSADSQGLMREQIRRLQEVMEWPNLTLRIVPFDVGLYTRSRIAYVLLEFPEVEQETVLFIETVTDDVVIRESNDDESELISPVSYLETFWQLEQLAPIDATPGLLEDALAGLRDRRNTAPPATEPPTGQ
ncbi:helix-turn-helix domain-containing protein [Embleya sp. NBC_00896]|uniref:helix-turn-helix domain-containing protein n=1 Tax=Embleya sp. NBC_00896 TaxID=2975961 RepID=UPI00386CF449|nr:helix-turn-helix transcriptional regulator [Embleya sp. NBC_00896]